MSTRLSRHPILEVRQHNGSQCFERDGYSAQKREGKDITTIPAFSRDVARVDHHINLAHDMEGFLIGRCALSTKYFVLYAVMAVW